MTDSRYYKSDYALSVENVRRADDSGHQHRRVQVERLLHFLRRDVGAGADDDLLLSAFEPVIAVGVAGSEISGAQPSVHDNGLGGCRVAPITNAVGGAADDNLTGFVIANILSAGIDDPKLEALLRYAHRARP